MWSILLIISFVLAAGFSQGLSLWHKGLRRELLVFACLLALGAGLSLLWVKRVPLPNPFDWITAIYKPVYESMIHWLQ